MRSDCHAASTPEDGERPPWLSAHEYPWFVKTTTRGRSVKRQRKLKSFLSARVSMPPHHARRRHMNRLTRTILTALPAAAISLSVLAPAQAQTHYANCTALHR